MNAHWIGCAKGHPLVSVGATISTGCAICKLNDAVSFLRGEIEVAQRYLLDGKVIMANDALENALKQTAAEPSGEGESK